MAQSIPLADLLAQHQQIEENQALLVFGLQNDFISSEGKLPVPLGSGWLENIKNIVPKFRDFVGDVIWVRSEFREERRRSPEEEKIIIDALVTDVPLTNDDLVDAGDGAKVDPKKRTKGKKRKTAKQFFKELGKKDQPAAPDPVAEPEEDELFLTRSGKGPACMPGSKGAEFPDEIQELIKPEDLIITKSHYSAFDETDLLVRLRMSRNLEVFIVGCMTNLSVYATAQDAASHGFTINILQDCLGYRTYSRHDLALRTLCEYGAAYITSSTSILEEFEAFDQDEMPERAGSTTNGAPEGVNFAHMHRISVQSDDVDVTALAESLAIASLGPNRERPFAPPSASRPPTAVTPSRPTTAAPDALTGKTLRSFKSTPDMRNRGHVRMRARRKEDDLAKVPELPPIAGATNGTAGKNAN